ncbi:MAG: metalloregulator ArsR/SmtB family transcription factor [Pirellulaceae bacterium]|jgi:ArsR family transcriptional regulator|nr:metalloregulator ArsR/SmtB family transcription factor [Pirellulaceae bacterium]
MLSRTAFSASSRGSLANPAATTLAGAPEADPADALTKELVRWFKLLADETRLRILLFLLEKGELNVRTLCDLLRLSQPAVSHHLALLRGDGLLDCRRDGKHNFYRVLPDRFTEVLNLVAGRASGDEPRVRLGDFVLTFRREAERV